MTKIGKVALLSALLFSPVAYAVQPTVSSPTALDAAQVTTGGTAVVVIKPGEVYNGCYIQNPASATTNLIIDPVNTASSSAPASTASIIAPGNSWTCPGAVQNTVTVVSSDSAHPFYGVKF